MSKRTYIGKALGDTEYMLEQWGLWRTSGMGVPRYMSPTYALMRDNVAEPCRMGHCITDDLAMMVDGCVARLAKRESDHNMKGPTMGECVWFYFGAKWPAARVGRHYGVSEAKAREIIKAGVAWIDSAIEYMREAA